MYKPGNVFQPPPFVGEFDIQEIYLLNFGTLVYFLASNQVQNAFDFFPVDVSYMFFAACTRFLLFPCLTPVTCFPVIVFSVLDTVYTFSCAWALGTTGRLDVSLRFTTLRPLYLFFRA